MAKKISKHWIKMTSAERRNMVKFWNNITDEQLEAVGDVVFTTKKNRPDLDDWIERNIPFGRAAIVKFEGREFLAFGPGGYGGTTASIKRFLKTANPEIMPTEIVCNWITKAVR